MRASNSPTVRMPSDSSEWLARGERSSAEMGMASLAAWPSAGAAAGAASAGAGAATTGASSSSSGAAAAEGAFAADARPRPGVASSRPTSKNCTNGLRCLR